MSDERANWVSAQRQFRQRAEEYGNYALHYGDVDDRDKVLSKLYALLKAECCHAANYYEDLLHPLTAQPGDTHFSLLFEHLSKLHLDLAHRHEQLKDGKNTNKIMHQRLESFHRNMGHARAEEAKLFKRGVRLEAKR